MQTARIRWLARRTPFLLIGILSTGVASPLLVEAEDASKSASTRAAGVLAEADAHLIEREKLANSLIALAKDKSVQATDRERAISTLARLRTESGRRFMLENIWMEIPLARQMTSDEQSRAFACRYYLSHPDYRDWETVTTLMTLLETEQPAKHFGALSGVLHILFHQQSKVAEAMLDVELKRDLSEIKRQQLLQLKDYVRRRGPP